MEAFLQFWEHIAAWQRVVILLAGMILFWVIEGYYPLFSFSWKRYRHAGTNLFFLGTTVVLNLLFGATTIWICTWVTNNGFGLFNLVELPLWLMIVAGLFFMDFFAQYLPHYLMHKVRFMWRFHMIHHSDTKVDVTTGTRHHPGEWLFRETATIAGVLLLGFPVGMYFLYRSVSAIFTHFNHANIRVPVWIDKPISWILVSPNMHKVHHHFERPYTDKNFGNIFSLWDRIFGTFAYDDPRNLRYGLDVLKDGDDENIAYQMKIPFNRDRRG